MRFFDWDLAQDILIYCFGTVKCNSRDGGGSLCHDEPFLLRERHMAVVGAGL
jgi:hypothetical protein